MFVLTNIINVDFTKEICFHKLCQNVTFFCINFYIMFVLLSNIFILYQINYTNLSGLIWNTWNVLNLTQIFLTVYIEKQLYFFVRLNTVNKSSVHIYVVSQRVDKGSAEMSLWAPDERHRGIARRGVEQLNRRGAVRFTRKLTPAAHCGPATISQI